MRLALYILIGERLAVRANADHTIIAKEQKRMEQKFCRKISRHGAVTIPRAVRAELGIYPGDGIEIDVQDGKIVIDRHRNGCICCGNTADLIRQGDKYICSRCIRDLAAKRAEDNYAEQPGQTRLDGAN